MLSMLLFIICYASFRYVFTALVRLAKCLVIVFPNLSVFVLSIVLLAIDFAALEW